MADLSDVDSRELLQELVRRGGHPGALAEAALFCAKKSEDYNQCEGTLDIHRVDRRGYFPFGAASYAQMLHTKAKRFVSLVRRMEHGEAPNFEGLLDTAIDIINYAGFYMADPVSREKLQAPCGVHFEQGDRRHAVGSQADPKLVAALDAETAVAREAALDAETAMAREAALVDLFRWLLGYDVKVDGLVDFAEAATMSMYPSQRYAWRSPLVRKLKSLGVEP